MQPPLKGLIAHMLAKATTPETLSVIESLKGVCACLECDDLELSLSNAVHHRMESSQALRLSSLVNAGIHTPAQAGQLLAVFNSIKNAEWLHGQLRDAFTSVRPQVVRFFSTGVQADGSTELSMQTAFTLAKLYLTEKTLHSLEDAVAEADKKHMGFVGDLALLTIRIRDLLGKPHSAELAPELLKASSNITSFKTSKKHVGVSDLEVQTALDSILDFYGTHLQKPLVASIVACGMLAFAQVGRALLQTTLALQAVAGFSPASDGKVWHECCGSLPPQASEDCLWSRSSVFRGVPREVLVHSSALFRSLRYSCFARPPACDREPAGCTVFCDFGSSSAVLQ